MGELYKLRVSIEDKIKADNLDAAKIRGEVGLRTGRLLSLINPSTPDDMVAIAKFRQVAKELLNLSL